ncbi:hypothetical protein ACFLQ3_01590 [Bacteroidota bacterium]
MKKILITFFVLSSFISYAQKTTIISDYLDVLEKTGQEPVKFVNNLLDDYDLLVFDDALHLAKEPFDFYQELIKNDQFRSKVKYVFFEVISITSQPYIDKYFNSPVKDSTILIPAFQDSYSGYGWRYKTYFDLLRTIWDVNSQLPASERIQVICVDEPIYWDAIHTREDYNLFQKSIVGRDYFMYLIINNTLADFKSGEKGIFLTNTRHAYKGIKASDGTYYWNTGTFLHQWHPEKTYSIRFQNVNLSILAVIDSVTNASTEGMDNITYEWIRMDNGLWDKAFKENGNGPIAISLENNAFGKTPYVGNLMLNSADNQTMYDAYDGLIFLGPLEEKHFSAKVDFIYTDSFIQELKRRIILLEGDQLPAFLKQNGADSLDDFIKEYVKYQEERKNTLVPEEIN